MVFYLSGNSFAVIFENGHEDWEGTLEKIREYFGKTMQLNGIEFSVTAAMTILSYENNAKNVSDAVDMLECALSEAKTSGNEALVYANEEMLQKVRREQQILQMMKQAIWKGGFEVFYQAIYSVEEKRFTSAEALVRMRSPEQGYIRPDEFIPIAEKNGLITKIGEIVFRDVCRFMTGHRIWEKGIACVDVNLSAVQCMQANLYETLLSIMDEYDLPYQYINLEITETAATVSGENLRHNMEQLSKRGVNFSMDDYGTGFSNMINLIEYPFQIIKLDKSLVWSAMENEKAMCALKYTIGMVKEMGMKLIAEGVETIDQAQKLEELGCDFFQGYYYAKPVNGAGFLQIL
jgi:EAL domain-containing protein (putative c-di-GMP-specific phosphodiesterase class I)